MSEQENIEARLANVEQEIAELNKRLSKNGDNTSWIERIAGSFKDDPDFDEIVRLGREFRKTVE